MYRTHKKILNFLCISLTVFLVSCSVGECIPEDDLGDDKVSGSTMFPLALYKKISSDTVKVCPNGEAKCEDDDKIEIPAGYATTKDNPLAINYSRYTVLKKSCSNNNTEQKELWTRASFKARKSRTIHLEVTSNLTFCKQYSLTDTAVGLHPFHASTPVEETKKRILVNQRRAFYKIISMPWTQIVNDNGKDITIGGGWYNTGINMIDGTEVILELGAPTVTQKATDHRIGTKLADINDNSDSGRFGTKGADILYRGECAMPSQSQCRKYLYMYDDDQCWYLKDVGLGCSIVKKVGSIRDDDIFVLNYKANKVLVKGTYTANSLCQYNASQDRPKNFACYNFGGLGFRFKINHSGSPISLFDSDSFKVKTFRDPDTGNTYQTVQHVVDQLNDLEIKKLNKPQNITKHHKIQMRTYQGKKVPTITGFRFKIKTPTNLNGNLYLHALYNGEKSDQYDEKYASASGGYDIKLQTLQEQCPTPLKNYIDILKQKRKGKNITDTKVTQAYNASAKWLKENQQIIQMKVGDGSTPISENETSRVVFLQPTTTQDDLSRQDLTDENKAFCKVLAEPEITEHKSAFFYECNFQDIEDNKQETNVYFRLFDRDLRTKPLLQCFANSQTLFESYYEDNAGEIKIAYTYFDTSNKIQMKFVDDFIAIIRNVLLGDNLKTFYESIVKEMIIQNIIPKTLMLYLVIQLMLFLFGVSSFTQETFIRMLVKSSIVIVFLSSTGWDLFHYYVVEPVMLIPEQVVKIFSEEFLKSTSMSEDRFYNEEGKFSRFIFFGQMINLFISKTINFKILSILFAPLLLGIVYVASIYFSLIYLIYGFSKALIIYIFIYVGLAVFLALAPLFIPLFLFNTTKGIAQQWMNTVIGFMMQDVLLSLYLIIMGSIIYFFFIGMLQFEICWDTVITLDIFGAAKWPLISFWKISGTTPIPKGKGEGIDFMDSIGKQAGLGPDFITIICYMALVYIFVNLIDKIVDFGSKMAGGAVTASYLASGALKKFDKFLDKYPIKGLQGGKNAQGKSRLSAAVSSLANKAGGKTAIKKDQRKDKMFSQLAGGATRSGVIQQSIKIAKNSGMNRSQARSFIANNVVEYAKNEVQAGNMSTEEMNEILGSKYIKNQIDKAVDKSQQDIGERLASLDETYAKQEEITNDNNMKEVAMSDQELADFYEESVTQAKKSLDADTTDLAVTRLANKIMMQSLNDEQKEKFLNKVKEKNNQDEEKRLNSLNIAKANLIAEEVQENNTSFDEIEKKYDKKLNTLKEKLLTNNKTLNVTANDVIEKAKEIKEVRDYRNTESFVEKYNELKEKARIEALEFVKQVNQGKEEINQNGDKVINISKKEFQQVMDNYIGEYANQEQKVSYASERINNIRKEYNQLTIEGAEQKIIDKKDKEIDTLLQSLGVTEQSEKEIFLNEANIENVDNNIIPLVVPKDT